MTFEEWLETDEGVRDFGLELRKEYIYAARAGWNAATENAAKICEKLPETGLPGDGPWFNNDMISAAFDCANAIRSNAELRREP